MTQNKTDLVDVLKISVSNVLAAKNVLIIGKFAPSSVFHTNEMILGTYSSLDEAKAELKNIQEHIKSGILDVYEMK
jgi:hypothetical protein